MPLPARPGHRGLIWALLLVTGVVALAISILPGASAASSNSPTPVQAAAIAVESNGWTKVFSAPEISSGMPFHFYGMTFVNASVGYAYGGASWRDGDFNTPGRIYKTSDSGSTWRLVHESNGWKIGMACWNENNCWAGGKWGRVVYTQDGGNNWFQAPTYTWADPSGPTPTPVPFGAWIRSGATSKTAGSPVFFGATDNVILRSTNGQQFYNIWPLLPLNVATWSMTCPTASVCYGGQINQMIVKTIDGGLSWEYTWLFDAPNVCHSELPEPIQQRYYGLDFISEYWGWAVGSCGAIYRTGNGGMGWQAQNADISQDVQLRRVRMFNYLDGIAVGGEHPDLVNDPSMAQDAVIYVTTDGNNWSRMLAPQTDELHGLGAFGMTGVVVADWAGNIWRRAGSLLEPDPIETVTTTPTPTSTSTPTATPTSTETPTPTATSTPATGDLQLLAFVDVLGDGVRDPSDPPLSGVTFELQSGSQTVGECATDLAGACGFAELAPDSYSVVTKQSPSGYVSQVPVLVVSVRSGATTSVDVPFMAQTPTPTATDTLTPTPSPTATHTLTPTSAVQRFWLPMVVRQ